MGLLRFRFLSHFSCADIIAKGQLYQTPSWYGGNDGNIIVSLLRFPVVLWSVVLWSMVLWTILMLYPVWVMLVLTNHRNLACMNELDCLVSPCISYVYYYIDPKVWAIGSWKVCVERQMQYKFPCIPVHSCLQICTNTACLAEKEHHHQTGLANFIWTDKDVLQTPRDTFSGTSWGFSYPSPININETSGAKSTRFARKMYPWGLNSQQQKQHKPFYPQDFCFRDPWREQNTLCGSLNLFTVHKWTDAAG